MVETLRDMLFVVNLFATAIVLPDFHTFQERTKDMDADEMSAEYTKVYEGAIMSLQQTQAIPSALPKSLFKAIDEEFVRHLSESADFFGSATGTPGHSEWESGWDKYSEAVVQLFKAHAAASTHNDTDSPDLKLIDDQLVNKWSWLHDGLFAGHIWTLPTKTPFLTQTVIKLFDSLIVVVSQAIALVR